MSYQDIIFEKSGQIGIITLNRPERLNAFTWTMGNGNAREALEFGLVDEGAGRHAGLLAPIHIPSGGTP